ncbi:hypothetical protein HGRIS_004989 [Hohenbuehelia grisea]|uniref:Heterokaryon incompatibility domain-containing protein n=1 Tax=Hohenbuehelia grisea TaxID=104357 RepID=A0ABR3JDL2_9AGAR
MADQALTLRGTLDVCNHRAASAQSVQFTPLRCMKRRDDGAGYIVEKYIAQKYIAISYTWPSQGWLRLHDSNQRTPIFRIGASKPLPCEHFSVFARKAAEAIGTGYVVWLDYECIDQSSAQEKAIQVPVMDKIYNKAAATVILLEDIEMSTAEYELLKTTSMTHVQAHFPEYLKIVRRILGARWFSRAWCSQELILSRCPAVFVHRSDNPNGPPIRFDVSSLKHWMERAAMRDPSIKNHSLSDPRGLNPMTTRAGYFANAMAWALGVVYPMGCYNHYDKIALVDNLIQADISARIAIPAATDKSNNFVVVKNVVKIVNALAVLRKDYSLLLTSHVTDNPLQAVDGFNWGGPSIKGDSVSESWSPRLYETDKAGIGGPVGLDATGLLLKGVATEVIGQVDWKFWRDEADFDVLKVSIDGKSHRITSNWLSQHYPTSFARPLQPDQALFRDLCYVIEHFHAIDIYRLIFEAANPEEWYYDEAAGDLKSIMQRRFSGWSPTFLILAAKFAFMREGGKFGFSIVKLAGNSQLLVRGNIADLRRKTLFQPYVTRPKEFTTMIPTVNSFVLSAGSVGLKAKKPSPCLGAVRGFGLIPETSPGFEIRIS